MNIYYDYIVYLIHTGPKGMFFQKQKQFRFVSCFGVFIYLWLMHVHVLSGELSVSNLTNLCYTKGSGPVSIDSGVHTFWADVFTFTDQSECSLRTFCVSSYVGRPVHLFVFPWPLLITRQCCHIPPTTYLIGS